MKRHVFIGLAVWMASAAASAETLRLPAGATWLLTAPSARSASDSFAPLLKNTGTWSVAVTHLRVNFELRQDTGFALLDAAELSKNGVDSNKNWTLFDHQGVRYLGVFLSINEAFDAAVSKWAGLRGLPVRSEITKSGVKKVTWSRAAGTRPAMGYARKGDVAVVLLDAGGRSDSLEGALKAWDDAAPVKAPVEGALVAWSSSWRGAKDVWLALSPRPTGMDVSGSAREASGWFVRDGARSQWVMAGTSAGAKKEVPFRMRTTPGEKMLGLLESMIKPIMKHEPIRQLPLKSAKGIELTSLKVDADALKNSSKRGEIDWAGVLSPLMRFQVKEPVASTKFATVHLKSDASGALLVPTANTETEEIGAAGSPSMKCDAGTAAVAAVRFDVAQLSESLLPVGLISAMRNDILLGVFGVQAEYGHLMRASRPLVALVCEEPKGRVSYKGSWTFTPR